MAPELFQVQYQNKQEEEENWMVDKEQAEKEEIEEEEEEEQKEKKKCLFCFLFSPTNYSIQEPITIPRYAWIFYTFT